MKKEHRPPGPGSWSLDAGHCERPHSRYVAEFFPQVYTSGMRACMARYGLLLDTIEVALVDGFTYQAVRPLGAPPDAARPPPKLVFKALLALHPALRARLKRAEEVLAGRLWRADVQGYLERTGPATEARLRALQRESPASLDDAGLLAHLERCRGAVAEGMHDHFHLSGACMLPVGDLIAHVTDWTGCRPDEPLALLTGYSPQSLDAVVALDRAVQALRALPAAGELLAMGPAAAFERLRGLDAPAGPAVSGWLELVEHRILTGHDVAELTAAELPNALLETLRTRLAAPEVEEVREETERRRLALRSRVPEAHRAEFDALLEEARLAHPLRDGRSAHDFWGLGLLRRALLEVGRRLAEAGRLANPRHAVELEHGEAASLLQRAEGPSPEEVRARFEARLGASSAEMPERLGGPPPTPPPLEWLPDASRRLERAMSAYVHAAFQDGAPERNRTATELRGVGASPGRCRGSARLVRSPEDFGRIRPGDVLVARITSPAYNVVLPLLAGVVTERGGLLSHPAIVSREYGIPGIVGARGALDFVTDGALVELDGHAGTLRVVA